MLLSSIIFGDMNCEGERREISTRLVRSILFFSNVPRNHLTNIVSFSFRPLSDKFFKRIHDEF